MQQIDALKTAPQTYDELEGRCSGDCGPSFEASAAPKNPWGQVKTPSRGPVEAIGNYSAGCLRGASKIVETSAFAIMRPARNRYYGHPDLLAFIETLARKSQDMGLMLVGDLAQPRGGPTMSTHVSHQTGLDVDIWYSRLPQGSTPSREEREKTASVNMVLPDFGGLNDQWDPRVVGFLKTASEQPKVQRILVNPVIKREACRLHKGEDWLGKLRPWWGHDDHTHIRLLCPADSKHCQAQEAVPPGDGCDASLDEWFTERKKKENQDNNTNPKPPEMPKLPAACAQVLAD